MTSGTNNILFTVILLLSIMLGTACTQKQSGEEKEQPLTTQQESISSNVVLADPFILLHKDTYYAYGTSTDEGFEVFYSDNLSEWKRHTDLVLNKKDSYGEKWFWAPEVYYKPENEKFYLFYSVEEHLCVATSDSPLGPFVQEEKRPMLEEKGIDSSLFIDDDGTPYLFFVRFTGGNVIWGAELESNWMTIKEETLKQCIEVELDWEKEMGKVAEGPSLVKKDGIYYLIYSANHFESQGYGVGFATADSPLGNWSKSEKNPILQKPKDGLMGTGHGALFTDKEGKLKYVFHAHFNQQKVQPRVMYIVDVEMAKDNIKMDPNSIIPAIEVE